jgi:hypothetical protein
MKADQSMLLSQGKQGLSISLHHGKHQRNMQGTSYWMTNHLPPAYTTVTGQANIYI